MSKRQKAHSVVYLGVHRGRSRLLLPLLSSVSTVEQKLGRRIANLRQKIALTQAELAEASGYSEDFIGLVERGINAPSVSGLDRIAKALKVPLRDLFDF